MFDSFLIVIRSAGERTTALCREIAAGQVPEDNIVVIREAPFTQAIKRTFELGIERALPWTLALDADVLLHANAVGVLHKVAAMCSGNIFEVQGCILDKLFACPRAAGNHLFRTRLLEDAIKHIPEENIAGRPESFVIRKMENDGYPQIQLDNVLGLHDFEQFYRDIFRKSFQHGQKHRRYIPYLEPLWRRLSKHDPDYVIARRGLKASKKMKGFLNIDVRPFEEMKNIFPRWSRIREKAELAPEHCKAQDIERLIDSFQLPPEHVIFQKILDGAHDN